MTFSFAFLFYTVISVRPVQQRVIELLYLGPVIRRGLRVERLRDHLVCLGQYLVLLLLQLIIYCLLHIVQEAFDLNNLVRERPCLHFRANHFGKRSGLLHYFCHLCGTCAVVVVIGFGHALCFCIWLSEYLL